jgi:catechol 2,3-dioxygenase-like lactoylglutathione lyase family enzyme
MFAAVSETEETMLAYVTLGTNNKEKALAFYDAVLGEMGAKRFFANERLQFYGVGPGQPMIGIGDAYDQKPATVGNGVMPALACASTEVVDKVYAKAIALGATDEGAPGNRMPTFYGAYFRDPDGNKICVCKLG